VPPGSRLRLSAVGIEFIEKGLQVVRRAYPGDEEFARLREREDLFVYRESGRAIPEDERLVMVALRDQVLDGLGAPTEIQVQDHLGLLAALLQVRILDLLGQLKLTRRRHRGFRRINRNDDLVAKAFASLHRPVPAALHGFHKYRKTEFQVRVVDLPGSVPAAVLAFEFRRHFEIDPSLQELCARGIDLQGVWLRDPEAPPSERLLGTFMGLDQEAVTIGGPEGIRTYSRDRCRPEASLTTFAHVFSRVLSPQAYDAYLAAEWTVQAATASGKGYIDQVAELTNWFGGQGPLAITPSLSCRFGNTLTAEVGPPGSAAHLLPSVQYCFASDGSALDEFPFRGLDRFGPFDSRTFDKKTPRLMVVMPDDCRADAEAFERRLLDGMAKEGQKRFARGLVGIYGLSKVVPQRVAVRVPRQGAHDVGQHYVAAIGEALDPSKPPDVGLIVVRDGDAFTDSDNAYLAAKAYLLSQGVPTQEIRLSTMRGNTAGLPYILENIAVALYAKLGGSPWTVVPTMPVAEEIVIGMGVAEDGSRFETRRRYAGITTVFRSDGTYVLAAASPRCHLDQFPAVLTDFVSQTLRRLSTIRGWQEGDLVRLVFHAHQPLKRTDIGELVARAVSQLGSGVQFETAFLTIRRDHPFKVADPDEPGREKAVQLTGGGFGRRVVGSRVPARGTVVHLGDTRRLLCVSGSVLVKREGEPIPQPLLVELHSTSTYRDLDALTRQVFHATGLSWRSMLPVGEPVTIFYSHLIADLLARLDGVAHWSDALLDTKLRRSRWFL
jgi:hypothetical protein